MGDPLRGPLCQLRSCLEGGARRSRRGRRSRRRRPLCRLEVEAPWGDPPRGPCASCGRAWRATRGGIGEGGGASRRRMPQARPRVASGGVGLQASRGRREAGGGQAEAAGPGRRALPQPRAVDSPSRRRLGGGLDRRRRCAAVVVGGSGGGGCARCVEAAGLGSGGGGCAVGGGRGPGGDQLELKMGLCTRCCWASVISVNRAQKPN